MKALSKINFVVYLPLKSSSYLGVHAELYLTLLELVRDNWVPMEKVLGQEISDETMGFPVDRMSHMALGPMINDKERVLITGSNNDFGGRPRFTQSLAWLVPSAVSVEHLDPELKSALIRNRHVIAG